MNQKIKLLLVDDHKIIRDGIKSILKPSKKLSLYKKPKMVRKLSIIMINKNVILL